MAIGDDEENRRQELAGISRDHAGFLALAIALLITAIFAFWLYAGPAGH